MSVLRIRCFHLSNVALQQHRWNWAGSSEPSKFLGFDPPIVGSAYFQSNMWCKLNATAILWNKAELITTPSCLLWNQELKRKLGRNRAINLWRIILDIWKFRGNPNAPRPANFFCTRQLSNFIILDFAWCRLCHCGNNFDDKLKILPNIWFNWINFKATIAVVELPKLTSHWTHR